VAKLRHIHNAGGAAKRTGIHQVGALQGVAVKRKGPGGGELQAAAAMRPRAGEQRQHADGTGGGASVLAALNAVVQADGSRLAGVAMAVGVGAGETDDGVCIDAGRLRRRLRCVLRQHGVGVKSLEAVGVGGDVGGVFKAFAEDDVHHREREQAVGAGADGEVFVGERCGAGAVGVDDDEFCAAATGLFEERPEMDVVAVDVRAPGDDEAGVGELLGWRAKPDAVDAEQRRTACGRADGPVELRGA
jgi:hypothetical protein